MYIDPISDLFLRIKNASKAKHLKVVVKTSKFVLNILEIMKNEGYIAGYTTQSLENNKKETIVDLKYKNKTSSISGIRQISRPGLRIYTEANKIPVVLNGLGVSIISTSKGLMTGKQAKKLNCGGEVVAYIW